MEFGNNRSDLVTLSFEEFGEEQFLKISHSDKIRPFFMSVVSDSDHWMFISSNGGLTAGRKNSEFSLFPYYTDDKINEFADITGSKTIIQVRHGDDTFVWEPFSSRSCHGGPVQRNLYKSIYGNKIIFEELLTELKLTFRYGWSSSNEFGFVKTSTIINEGTEHFEISLLDGIQNIMPYGVSSDLQRASSNLVDAYKRSELDKKSGLGIFALSAIIVDKAEPSEALKANIVWSTGLVNPKFLMSSGQLDKFRSGEIIFEETDIKGEKGAYFANFNIQLGAGDLKKWHIVADVNKNHSQIVKLMDDILSGHVSEEKIVEDIQSGTHNLISLVAASDGLQNTNDRLQDCRSYSNVLFNIMRGGIFDNNYSIDTTDFLSHLEKSNYEVFVKYKDFLNNDNKQWDYKQLIEKVKKTNDVDLIRLSIEYLPLKFSRRHGDPSRPWNKFSINLRDENSGNKILDYEGNWRDIFQNWEALAYSFPEYIDGMIFKFLNASTFDGYNPYRISKDGFDWETIEPDDPWSYIGYWGDHQIIYLLKFLEIIDKFKPGVLQSYFDQDLFVYACVPYLIKPYEDIVVNPKDTIDFDHSWDLKIRERRIKNGSDGAVWRDNDDSIYHVNLIEKLLATLLAKMSNFIPEGGIWLNTQRPEWNDANNALVGNGVSMVTLYYIRRFLVFLNDAFAKTDLEYIKLSNELIEFYHSIRETLEENLFLIHSKIKDSDRKKILDKLGIAASEYRSHIYKSGFWGKKRSASLEGLRRFVKTSLQFIDHTIEVNERNDGLFHAYNLMTYHNEGVSLSYLDEMLEGQVAVLSSGKLNARQSLKVLDAMKSSSLFRPDQYSYILYPNKELPGFLQKNNISEKDVASSRILQFLIDNNNTAIIEKDVKGNYHFNGNFKNANDLKRELQGLDLEDFKDIMAQEQTIVLEMFENVFNHKSFTGRSGTFYGYEGLGSIYWHMVSKLLLAVQESSVKAINNLEDPKLIGKLLDHYYEIQAGIGVHKSPELYGAFPTDPYSHTPMHRGAQQPGMTGQVKEDILCRWGELGIEIIRGKVRFNPSLLRKSEFLQTPQKVDIIQLDDTKIALTIGENQLLFTYCQVPVIYELGEKTSLEISYFDGLKSIQNGDMLGKEDSQSLFYREGKIQLIKVTIDKQILK